jgi:hypothetical protein
MVELQDIFEVKYGVNLELNKLKQKVDGVNFVSRTAKNNGVSATVELVSEIKPIKSGVITVSGGGSVLEAFLQPEPFYSGRDLYYLIPKFELSDTQKLYYCACIRANKYRYSYGRQANRTLRSLKVPHFDDFPDWVNDVDLSTFDDAKAALKKKAIDPLKSICDWKEFTLEELFDLKKGKRLTKAKMLQGKTPFIGSTDSNNGLTNTVGQDAIHDGNVISVNYNGSVGEAFYQPVSFWASDDVNVLYPKDCTFNRFNSYIALFIIPIIRLNKFKFSYGRKWHMDRMKESKIVLPVKNNQLDLKTMEDFIKSLPYSSNI